MQKCHVQTEKSSCKVSVELDCQRHGPIGFKKREQNENSKAMAADLCSDWPDVKSELLSFHSGTL